MRPRFSLLLPMVVPIALGACGPTPVEQAAQDARDVAAVIANQEPPPEVLEPQPITYPDIERNDLFGAGCNFVAEGGGIGAIALAQAEEGYMKRGGEVLTFAADKGSAQQPLNSYRRYTGREYAFTLDIETEQAAAAKEADTEVVNYPARLTVIDGRDRTVYEASGIAQCGS